MKTNVLLVFLSFLWTDVMAQPEAVSLLFVEEGKSWDVTFMTHMNTQSYKMNYIIEGDTIIQGRQYKKMFAKEEGTYSYRYRYALREDGGKVYSIFSSGAPADETLWYDFNVSEGDEIEVEKYSSLLHITGTDYIYVNGVKRKRIHINLTRKDLSIGLTGVWVEGIGSNLAPDNPYGWGLSRSGDIYMDKCSVDGKTLFTYSDFAVPGWTENVTGLKSQHSVIPLSITNTYDLQGRRLADKPQKGVYIKDGRKYVK